MNKLDKIRFELMQSTWANRPYDTSVGWEPDRGSYKYGFFDGWDAAMERVKPLIEALEYCASDLSREELDGFEVAKSALTKFRGEETIDPDPNAEHWKKYGDKK